MGMYPRSDADILSNPRGLSAPFFALPQSVQAITTLCLFDTAYDTMYNKTGGVNMSQLDKLIQRIRELDKNMRFEATPPHSRDFSHELGGAFYSEITMYVI